MSLLPRIIPAFLFWVVFIFVVLKIPYPDSLTQANLTQVVPFFSSLYLALLFTFNIALKNMLLSGAIALGLIFLLILKALDSLNLVTVILTLLATGLLASYFRKMNKHLTKQTKIPKLTQLRK